MTTTKRRARKMRKRRLQSNCSLVMKRERLNQVEQKVQLSSDCAACSRLASVTGSSLPSPREHGHVRVVCTVVRWSDAGLPGVSVVKNPPANTGGVRDAGSVPVYSHLFQNFPQFVVIHTVKGFGIVNKAEIDVFLELSCFF